LARRESNVGRADDRPDRVLYTGISEIRRRISGALSDAHRPDRIVALVVLLFLTEMQELSFITGLVVGMLVIQIFFHRFDKPLAAEQSPESGAPPRKVMSYAIQADPGLAWREIVVMTLLFVWALYQLIDLLVG
jgi:hypothetical protein